MRVVFNQAIVFIIARSMAVAINVLTAKNKVFALA
jgi:hypothetical protein